MDEVFLLARFCQKKFQYQSPLQVLTIPAEEPLLLVARLYCIFFWHCRLYTIIKETMCTEIVKCCVILDLSVTALSFLFPKSMFASFWSDISSVVWQVPDKNLPLNNLADLKNEIFRLPRNQWLWKKILGCINFSDKKHKIYALICNFTHLWVIVSKNDVYKQFSQCLIALIANQQRLKQRLSFPGAKWNSTLTHYYYVLSGCFFVFLIPQVHLLQQTKLFTCPHLSTKAVHWDETLVQTRRYISFIWHFLIY